MSDQSKTPENIVIATHNPDKLIEIQNVLRDFNIPFLTLEDFPEIGQIEETGKTLADNSLIKANTVFQLTGMPVIADDTGLEVDALNGDPGVHTGRYAGEHASYSENIEKLLKAMNGIPQKKRVATFRTVMTYADGTKELQAEGSIKGVITETPIGDSGFGYDPIFFVPTMNKTFAEMSDAEKNIISHRGLALQNLRKLLIHRGELSKPTANRQGCKLSQKTKNK